jgi:Circadian oscillating protein COP23
MIKPRLFAPLVATAAIAGVILLLNSPARQAQASQTQTRKAETGQAQTGQAKSAQIKYFCDDSSNPPTTVASTLRGKIALIRWATTLGGGEYDPLKRCQVVSARFQTLYDNKQLRFLTTGRMNGQNVICAAADRNGGCLPNGLLFTLKPGSNPRTTLQQMFNLGKLATGGPILESTQQRLYVDLNELLETAPPAPKTQTP